MADLETVELAEGTRDALSEIIAESEAQVTPVAPATNGEKPPVWLQPLLETQAAQTKSLETTIRNLQGQVNSLQSRLNQPAKSPASDALTAMEQSDDPRDSALARVLREHQDAISRLNQSNAQTSMSTQDTLERQQWYGYLEETAEIVGASFRDIEPKLKNIATADLARKGRDIVLAGKKPVDNSNRDKIIQDLKDAGLYDLVKGGTADSSTDIEALDRMTKAFRKGKMTPQEYTEQSAPLAKKLS